MEHPFRAIASLCIELAGLALLAGAATLIAAFHVFDGFRTVDPQTAVLFCVAAVFLSLLALMLYAFVRISGLTAENRVLYRAATRDGLTRLLNRAAFQEQARTMMGDLGRRRGDPVALTLLVVDADHFKRINDRLGHDVGDRALRAIAATLAGSLRHDDLVGRMGGEEFGILLKGAGFEEAHIVAERLRVTINRLVVGTNAANTVLSASIGAVSFDRPVPFDFAYKQADVNLYKAKRGGRNRFVVSRLQLSAPVRSQRSLTQAVNPRAASKIWV